MQVAQKDAAQTVTDRHEHACSASPFSTSM
jgi:hypothetical protein